MGKFNLETFFLFGQKSIKQSGYNTCVVDYMWSQRWGKCGFKSYTFDKLKSELRDCASYYPMMNTEEIIDWAKKIVIIMFLFTRMMLGIKIVLNILLKQMLLVWSSL